MPTFVETMQTLADEATILAEMVIEEPTE